MSVLAVPRTRRAVAGLCVAAALMTAAMAVASAAATLVVADNAGTRWAGLPSTAGIVGTGVGAAVLPRLIGGHGPRRSLAVSYAVALAGALVAAAAAGGGSAPGLITGLLLLGAGNAAAQLTRYLAGDLFPAQRRGSAIALVVFGSTVGAVGGPLLLPSAPGLADAVGRAHSTGPFLLSGLAVLGALLATGSVPAGSSRAPTPVPLRELLASDAARAPLAAMVSAQVVMVAVMTAAPLEMHRHGAGLGPIGAVLSGHTLGMFAVSPLTGWLIDRRGPRPLMLAGLCAGAGAAAFAAGAAGAGDVPHGVVYFALGVAWNLAFVGGSTALSRGVDEDHRLALEGGVDAVVWSLAAAGGAASTVLLAAGGFPLLGATAAALAIVAATVVYCRPVDAGPARSASTRAGQGGSPRV